MEVLTAQDVRALKHADAIVFRYYEGIGTIEAIKRADRSDTGFEQIHKVEVANAVNDMNRKHTNVERGDTAYNCFSMVHTAQYNREWLTLVGHMSAGDAVQLVWWRSNQTEALTTAGLARDEFRLIITKKSGKQEHYLVDFYTGPDNTARMIKRGT